MSIPTGTVLYHYALPVKGVSKKVIYHISDIHLNHSDDPDAKMQPLTYETWLKGWPGFSIQYNEPYAPEQMKLPEEHLNCLLELANTGDAIIMTGDICDKVSHTNLKILDECLGKVDKPWIAVCGNHDLAADIPEGYLYTSIKAPVQSLDMGDLIIVGIDNSQRQVTADQTAQLREVLSLGKPVIVILHVPIMTDENDAILLNCGDYFRLNHPEATEETLAFIDTLRQNDKQIVAVFAGHLHFHNESHITPDLPQFVNSQSVLGNINRYVIGE